MFQSEKKNKKKKKKKKKHFRTDLQKMLNVSFAKLDCLKNHKVRGIK